MQLKIELYSSVIKIVLLNTLEDSKKYIQKINKKYNQNNEVYAFEGCVFYIGNRTYELVFVKPYINENVLSHESYHCSEKIADSCDLTTEGNKEDRAYLNAFINQKVREKINLVNSTK
jgi:hypothetical protein